VVIRNNLTCRPPRYYDSLYKARSPIDYEITKQERRENQHEITPERLRAKELVKLINSKKLKRSLEND